MIRFEVTGDPKGQPRPKAFARNMGGSWVARVYTPGTAEEWKSLVATAAKPHLPASPIDEPLSVEIELRFARPKGHHGKRGLVPSAPFHHTSKPDVDNAAKAILDALTQLGLWRDDVLVCDLRVVRRWADDRPGATITVRQLGQPAVVQAARPLSETSLFAGVGS